MPLQQTLLDEQIGDKRIEVVKTYDTRQAREAFDEMDEASHAFLWNALNIAASYEQSELPGMNTAEGGRLPLGGIAARVSRGRERSLILRDF